MKLGMTGSREGMSEKALDVLKEFMTSNEVEECHHGDCVGADIEFHNLSKELNKYIIIHPPNKTYLRSYCKGDESRDPLSYLDRNHYIVDETDMLIAFPKEDKEVWRSGTWSTIRYARKQGKRVYIVYPSGEVQEEDNKK